MSYFLFIPLRPFFYAALAKRWKVQFRKGLRKFNNVDSKTTYFNENCCIIYIYIYIVYLDISMPLLESMWLSLYIYIYFFIYMDVHS